MTTRMMSVGQPKSSDCMNILIIIRFKNTVKNVDGIFLKTVDHDIWSNIQNFLKTDSGVRGLKKVVELIKSRTAESEVSYCVE